MLRAAFRDKRNSGVSEENPCLDATVNAPDSTTSFRYAAILDDIFLFSFATDGNVVDVHLCCVTAIRADGNG